jgi:hypothetical protein
MSGVTPTATRGEVIATLAIVGGLAAVIASGPIRRRLSDHPSAAECVALLDRYVEHVVRAADPKVPAGDLSARKAQARALSSSDPASARCSTTLTKKEAECAMQATNADEFERCLP